MSAAIICFRIVRSFAHWSKAKLCVFSKTDCLLFILCLNGVLFILLALAHYDSLSLPSMTFIRKTEHKRLQKLKSFVLPMDDPISELRIGLRKEMSWCYVQSVLQTRRTFHGRVNLTTKVATARIFMFACLENIIRREHVAPSPAQKYIKTPVKNKYRYNYLKSQDLACQNRKIEILITIPSAPNNFQRRQLVRESARGRYARDPKNKVVLLFFLGLSQKRGHDIQQKIDEEAATHRDIVQSDFFDSYRNMRLKAISMLKWASTKCGHAKLVLRTDDDVEISFFDVINVFRRKAAFNENFVIGRRFVYDFPSVFPKWALPKHEYSYTRFPAYVIGGLIGYPMSTVKLLYEATLRYPPIWLDDTYVTGLCAGVLGIPVYSDALFDFVHQSTDAPPKRTIK